MHEIPLSSPDITEMERKAVLEVLNTRYLSLGPKVREFEDKFASYAEARHVIAVNSGTSGLHLCVKALEIGEGDEVITTPFSFVASANCLLYERALPIFVDIDPWTFNLDIGQIEQKITKRTKAILPVHVFGHPCNMDEILDIARKHNLFVIEDACEAIGAKYKHKKVGTLGDCGVFAFYPNKQMTTAEGGVIVTNNDEVAKLCRSMRNQGRSATQVWLTHERLGYNYRLSDIHCALGIVQLERIDELLSKRAKVACLYNELFKGLHQIRTPFVSSVVTMSWFVYVILLSDEFTREQRDYLIQKLRESGVSCSNYFPPIHLQPFYQQMFGYKMGDFPIAESVADRTIALPFYGSLPEQEISYVVETLKGALDRA